MATGSERGETIEADEDDEVVEYNREEYLRVVKLAQERKVVRKGWVENHVMGYSCRREQEVGFSILRPLPDVIGIAWARLSITYGFGASKRFLNSKLR
jgi:hypothetical protein